MSLVLYHVTPWLFAAAVVAPFVLWRRPSRLPDDIAGQVEDGEYRSIVRGMAGRR